MRSRSRRRCASRSAAAPRRSLSPRWDRRTASSSCAPPWRWERIAPRPGRGEGVVEPLVAARALLKLIEREQPLLVILGKQAIDDDNGQTGQVLAALWNRPQATSASKIELSAGTARVTREVDAGLETLEVDLPAVITTDLRLNEPRYVKLPDIMKAKKKPLDTLTLSALGVEQRQQLKLVRFEPPPQRQKGVRVKDAAELLEALKKKGLL